jgi:hypothetical protein
MSLAVLWAVGKEMRQTSTFRPAIPTSRALACRYDGDRSGDVMQREKSIMTERVYTLLV